MDYLKLCYFLSSNWFYNNKFEAGDEMKTAKRSFIILTVCVLMLTMCSFASAAKVTEDVPPVLEYNESDLISVYYNGIKVSDGAVLNDSTYVSLRGFLRDVAPNAELSWDTASDTVTVSCDGLEMTAILGKTYICANDRYFAVPDGVLLCDGVCVVPARVLAQIFGLDVEWDEETRAISLTSNEDSGMPKPAADYYVEEDLYWLSRLINAESGNQPLEGKIAVGNVVLNRVGDPTCPDTIYDVIFDDRFGEQFSVVSAGTIKNEPNEESVIAAKLCLEGYNNIEDAIYFVNPKIGSSKWFRDTRTFITTIGEHDFYA